MDALIASLPVLCLILGLNVLRLPSHWAALGAFGVAVLSGVLVYGLSISAASLAALEGVALAVWPILLVIVAALFLYRLSLLSGGMETVKGLLLSISADRRVIGVLVAWGFGAFLEGMAGFGTAVAIPAGMLIAMGFDPFRAALACLVANGVPTAYGSVGLPLTTLAKITRISSGALAESSSLQLFLLNGMTPFLVLYSLTGSLKSFRSMISLLLIAGFSLSAGETAVSYLAGPELSVIAASLVTMGAISISSSFLVTTPKEEEMEITAPPLSRAAIMSALFPFGLVFIFLLTASPVCPPVYGVLSAAATSVPIYPGVAPYTFSWLTAPGVSIFLAAVLAGFYQKLTAKDMGAAFVETVHSLRFTAVTLLAILATAKVMGYSGMTSDMANVLARASGPLYPAMAPFIGALGTFITGSATSSGVLFGGVQLDASAALSLNAAWIAASNETGAAIGKMISPQNIAIAAGAVGLAGKEGDLLSKALPYFAVLAFILGVVVYEGNG